MKPPKTLILYHGTTSQFLPDILAKGLQPRDRTEVANTWDEGLESRPGLVYLTNCFAMYFANHAAQEYGGNPAIVRVKVPRSWLFPDEDFLGAALGHNGEPGTLRERTIRSNPKDYKDYWRNSLGYSGAVASRPVPPGRIMGTVTIPRRDYAFLAALGADVTVGSPTATAALGARYAVWLKRLFDLPLEEIVEQVSRLWPKGNEHEEYFGYFRRFPFLDPNNW